MLQVQETRRNVSRTSVGDWTEKQTCAMQETKVVGRDGRLVPEQADDVVRGKEAACPPWFWAAPTAHHGCLMLITIVRLSYAIFPRCLTLSFLFTLTQESSTSHIACTW